MTTLQPAADTEYLYVDSAETLGRMIAWIEPAARLAADVEADSLYHYHEKVCLLQVTARGRNFLVDPLSRVDLGPLVTAMAARTVIFHGADYDLRMLRSSFGFRPQAGVIDTMIAARLLGLEAIGLGSLIEKFAGVHIAKGGQKSDWSRRPLTAAQLKYAVDDTRYLEPLADLLSADLDRQGRRPWFEQSCAAAIEAAEVTRTVDPDREWRLKGVRDLGAGQAAYVREIWHWREREASRVDRPPFKILANDAILALAIWAQANPHAPLANGPRLPRDFHGARMASLEDAIRRAAALNPEEWPLPRLRPVGPPLRPGRGLDRLRDEVARLAVRHAVDPSVIAPRSSLEEISRTRPTDAAGICRAGLMMWQAELLLPILRRVQGK
jgi:ribonuclease D